MRVLNFQTLKCLLDKWIPTLLLLAYVRLMVKMRRIGGENNLCRRLFPAVSRRKRPTGLGRCYVRSFDRWSARQRRRKIAVKAVNYEQRETLRSEMKTASCCQQQRRRHR